ncbi:MAG: glycosyltransferase family 4 protein [Candidatus Zixiibacteriota bacterium]
MTILHIDTGLKFRGGQRQISLLIKHLAKYDIKQYLAAPKKSPLIDVCKNNIEGFFPIGESNLMRFLGRGSLRKFIRNRNIDIVHAHDSHSHTLMVSLRLGKNRPRFVVTRRSSNPISIGSRTKYLRHEIKFIAVCENVKNLLLQGGVDENKVIRIPSMIELEKYSSIATSENKIANDHKFKIISAGAFDPSKGFITSIKAIELLVQKRRDFIYYIYGDGAVWNELKKYIKEKNLDDYIKCPGWVETPLDYWPGTDIYVSPSHNEGINGSLVEASACGICPVVTDIPSHREIVIEGETGMLFPIEDFEKLADQLNALMSQPELRQRISNRLKNNAVQYDAKVVTGQIFDLYRQLVAPSK